MPGLRGVFVVLLLAASVACVASGSAAPIRARTVIVRWSPFDAAGDLKPTLKSETKQGQCLDIGYTLVGGIGYRCFSGNRVYDACFRDGPDQTEYVICVGYPWQTSVVRLRSPHLLQYPGVTFSGSSDEPWGIVLDDGNRCGRVQGAHDSLTTRGKRYTVDYDCERGNVVLLREGLDRGPVWQVNAARSSNNGGYTFLGHTAVRSVYFGTLPPPMARQNKLASQAYNAAMKVIRRSAPKAHLDLVWMRLALPAADWAYAIFTSESATSKGWFAVLHRTNGKWADASADKPYCTKLPDQVREQLFLDKKSTHYPLAEFDAPHGETRC